jgi:hypothetical protein
MPLGMMNTTQQINIKKVNKLPLKKDKLPKKANIRAKENVVPTPVLQDHHQRFIPNISLISSLPS